MFSESLKKSSFFKKKLVLYPTKTLFFISYGRRYGWRFGELILTWRSGQTSKSLPVTYFQGNSKKIGSSEKQIYEASPLNDTIFFILFPVTLRRRYKQGLRI